MTNYICILLDINKKSYIDLISALNHYMFELDNADKDELLFYTAFENIIFIESCSNHFNIEGLNIMIRTCLKKNQFILVKCIDFSYYIDNPLIDSLKLVDNFKVNYDKNILKLKRTLKLETINELNSDLISGNIIKYPHFNE